MRKKIIIRAILALSSIAITPSVSFAHHGVNGQFDLSRTLETTGTVTRVRLVNPHSYVYFDVTNDAGKTEQWRCELRSGSLLKRKGWTKDLFAKGTKISIKGSPAHTEPTTCYTDTITFEDGKVLSRYGSIAKNGSIENPVREEKADNTPQAKSPEGRPPKGEARGGRSPDGKGPRTARGPATAEPKPQQAETTETVVDISGNWSEPLVGGPPRAYGVGRRPNYELTEAGIAEGKKHTAEENPRFQCKATNIIMDYRFDQMINKIEQTDKEVTISYGFMDVVRHINIDGEFPAEIEPSLAGYSVGTWNAGKLEVITKGFTAGFLEAKRGNRGDAVVHSDQMEIAESFYIDVKGELIHEYTITDPVYLAAPHSHLQKSVKTEDAFQKFDCDDLTVEKEYQKK